jgi:hypothetical protein
MYSTLINWIGSRTCNLAGEVSTVLDAGAACASGQSLNMGLIVVGLVALSLAVMVINARRRLYRERGYF